VALLEITLCTGDDNERRGKDYIEHKIEKNIDIKRHKFTYTHNATNQWRSERMLHVHDGRVLEN